MLGFPKTTASRAFSVITNSSVGYLQKGQLFRDLSLHEPDRPVATVASRTQPDFKKIFSKRSFLARLTILPSEILNALSEMHAPHLLHKEAGSQKIRLIRPTHGLVHAHILCIDLTDMNRLVLKH